MEVVKAKLDSNAGNTLEMGYSEDETIYYTIFFNGTMAEYTKYMYERMRTGGVAYVLVNSPTDFSVNRVLSFGSNLETKTATIEMESWGSIDKVGGGYVEVCKPATYEVQELTLDGKIYVGYSEVK